MRPDAIVRIRLKSTEAGGRASPIPPLQYRCPVFFGEQRREANDCVLLLNTIAASLEPGGESEDVPVKFLRRDLVAEHLSPGTRFVMWEGREIGEGEIMEVIEKTTGSDLHS